MWKGGGILIVRTITVRGPSIVRSNNNKQQVWLAKLVAIKMHCCISTVCRVPALYPDTILWLSTLCQAWTEKSSPGGCHSGVVFHVPVIHIFTFHG